MPLTTPGPSENEGEELVSFVPLNSDCASLSCSRRIEEDCQREFYPVQRRLSSSFARVPSSV